MLKHSAADLVSCISAYQPTFFNNVRDILLYCFLDFTGFLRLAKSAWETSFLQVVNNVGFEIPCFWLKSFRKCLTPSLTRFLRQTYFLKIVRLKSLQNSFKISINDTRFEGKKIQVSKNFEFFNVFNFKRPKKEFNQKNMNVQ